MERAIFDGLILRKTSKWNIGSPNSDVKNSEVKNLMDKEILIWEDIEIYAFNRIIDLI